MKGWYWINTKYACGGIYVGPTGLIEDTCPIWQVWKGVPAKTFGQTHKRTSTWIDAKKLPSLEALEAMAMNEALDSLEI